jgi:hypothetical protein
MSAPMPTNISPARSVRGSLTRAYLCGPMAKNCWRHRLVPGLREPFCENALELELARNGFGIELPTITPGVISVGPWFAGCEHRCAHGPRTHGAMGVGCDDGGFDVEKARSNTFHANIERIRRADAVFAYIDRKRADGSQVEIGFAKALGKPIFIGFPPGARWRDDLWFAAHAGLGDPSGHIGSVEAMWVTFCQALGVSLEGTKFE